MSKVLALLLIIVGLINFLPVLGVLSAERLTQAYSTPILGSDLEILMRHRALLFGIVGGFVLFSVFSPAYQGAAMTLAGISMLGFLLLVFQVGGHNAAIHKVMLFDVAGLVCLAAALVVKYGFKVQ
jgi:hypothetical protein